MVKLVFGLRPNYSIQADVLKERMTKSPANIGIITKRPNERFKIRQSTF